MAELPVVKMIATGGTIAMKIDPVKKAPVPAISGEDLISDFPDMKIGDRVAVIRGPLKGLEGTLVEFHQKHRVRIMIEGIQQSLHIKVPQSFLSTL